MLCWLSLLAEPAPSEAAVIQALGRARRLGNPSNLIQSYELFLKDSFNARHVQWNMKKALPTVAAELNRQLFSGNEGSEYEGEGDIDLGEWVILNGELIRGDDERVSWMERVEPEELLQFLMGKMKGSRYLVS